MTPYNHKRQCLERELPLDHQKNFLNRAVQTGVNVLDGLCCAGMERVVFYRERGALPYDPFAYGAAIAIVEVPYLILQVGAATTWY